MEINSFRLTKERHDLLGQLGYYFSVNRGNADRIGKELFYRSDVAISPNASILFGDLLFSIGKYSYCWSRIMHGFTVGNYSSLATDIEVMGDMHPLSRFTTSPVTYYASIVTFYENLVSEGGLEQAPYDGTAKPPKIGNDVWIGRGALLGHGIEIGDGAVIAARSIVTKDVPPYHVVAGSPARTIKMRFPEAVVERLLKSRWFDYDIATLKVKGDCDVETFLDRFEDGLATGEITKIPPAPLFSDMLHAVETFLNENRQSQPTAARI